MLGTEGVAETARQSGGLRVIFEAVEGANSVEQMMAKQEPRMRQPGLSKGGKEHGSISGEGAKGKERH